MQPIITSKGKSTQLRYELPQRVHGATIYPAKAPNGSTIILTALDNGVGIQWRGGRALKKAGAAPKQPAKPAKVNGTNNDAIMIIDSDDDEPAKTASQPAAEAEFEEEEEELDPDQPYPSFVQQIRLALGTEVLHIAVPQIPTISSTRPADTVPAIFASKMVFTVTCADCTVRVVTMPLSPPSNEAKQKSLSAKSQYGEDVTKIQAHQSIARGVTMTWTSRSEPNAKDASDDDMDVDAEEDAGTTPGRRRRKQQNRSRSRGQEQDGFDLLVASHSAELGGLLKLWRFKLTDTSLDAIHPVAPLKTITLRKYASRVTFNTAQYPKRRHSQLLITDATGTARVYDVFAPGKRRAHGAQSEAGAFISTFRSNFESVKNNVYTPAVLAARKPIIDATWVSDGRHILALLADGEWGVWDVDRSGPSPPADPLAFSLRGYVGTSEKESSASGASSPKKGSRSSLAPMTPNTRRRKEENLFKGSPSISAAAPHGGITVASLPSSNSAASEESVIIWYGSEVYRIADLAKFWSRTASASGGNSLPSPSLTQIQDISMSGESITSISQFDTTSQASRMAVPRDLLISAEHRLIIVTGTTKALGRDMNAMFSHAQTESDDSRRTDQALLSHGALDLGGMDRMLDDMDNSGTISKSLTLGGPRKVLFASSAA
ncbi:hypothetical protein HBH98_223480 [Parastagonospora nodorum]|nr:hypothetical protein HBH98_223480 [Parastagonospora nodorum]KAH4359234.1 hypothetical protein HBH97_212780 [Parastagonospora nodorum]KAH4373611.1 hypothetical protein HBH99_224830 [Parastagonospora nodorum]KAH4893681.1 hypothetical protein HBH74_198140 [Parastagonospora nodorum]KAH4921817.1 hypothetical protein HBH73_220400 [Parastagonospora nodorum]